MGKLNLPYKKIAVIGAAVVVTASNAVFLVLGWRQSNTQQSKLATAPSAGIKVSEQTNVDAAKQGERLGSDKYKFETLTASKVNEDQRYGNLVLATHQATGAHFVLALGSDVSLAGKLADGWTMQQLAKDGMWTPGGCSSKPSFLLQGKYIFIDDGKTKPTDKYSSYVLYNMQTSSYVYFGGNNFTDEQTKGERILKVTNENDQLVFYIDPTDKSGALHNSPNFKHAVGSDQQYVIRRVIDPGTLQFKDYKLSFTPPAGVTHYYIETAYGNDLIRFSQDGSEQPYVGSVSNNRIELRKPDEQTTLAYRPGNDETELEKHLSADLSKLLPDLMKGQPYQNNPYSTNFALTELGSNATVNFLVARYRFSDQQTPIVYDSTTGDVDPLVTSDVLGNGNYVPLGVF